MKVCVYSPDKNSACKGKRGHRLPSGGLAGVAVGISSGIEIIYCLELN